MKNLANDIKSYVDDLSTINSSNINVQENKPEVHLLFDMDYIGRNNFTLMNLSSALSTFGREYSSGATFKQGTDSYDIMIKYADETGVVKQNKDKTIDDLKHLEVKEQQRIGDGNGRTFKNCLLIRNGKYSQGESGKKNYCDL